MDEKAQLRGQLERRLGQEIPDTVWANHPVQQQVEDCLRRDDLEEFDLLKEMIEDRIELIEQGIREITGQSLVVSESSSTSRRKDQKGAQSKLDVGSLVGPKTEEMRHAMSQFFAGLADQYPDVIRFRKRVLGGKKLKPREVQQFFSSHALRFFTREQFSRWNIPIIGHTSRLLDYNEAEEINHQATLWVNLPGITKTVRYPRARGECSSTQPEAGTGKLDSPYTGLVGLIYPATAASSGEFLYPPYVWSGSVMDELHKLSEELADQFDWPSKDAAARFILTGEVPKVRPLEAKWVIKGGGSYLRPQYRVQFTIPPWLPVEEVVKACRYMQRQVIVGRNELPGVRTLEVAHFVWEQERLHPKRRLSWRELFEQWNKEHPLSKLPSYRNFRTYCMRGMKAVAELNFSAPQADDTNVRAGDRRRSSPIIEEIAWSSLQCRIEDATVHTEADDERDVSPTNGDSTS